MKLVYLLSVLSLGTCIAEEETKVIQPDIKLEKIMSPKRGSKLRKAICDTFRVPMKREVNGQKIVFVIHQLKASQSWAFINCTLQLSNGKPINWTNSKHAESATDGDLENVAVGLLKKDRLGNWAVVEHAFNFTDVIWTEWATKHNAPSGLFR